MIELVVSEVLHNNVPVAVVDRVDVPSQLSTTVTTGAAGVAGWVLTTTFDEGNDIHPAALSTVNVYVPAFAVINPVPEISTTAELKV